jgi:hypothetical protein
MVGNDLDGVNMNKVDYPTLENFMLTWFHHSYDFEELDDRLQKMKELKAVSNILDLQNEIKKLEHYHVSLPEMNNFLEEIETRTLTSARFVKFKHTIQSFRIN